MRYLSTIKHKNIWLLVVILMLMLGVVLLFYANRFKLSVDEKGPSQQISTDGTPKEVYNYNGEVVKIEDGIIIIKALKGANYLLSDKELKVKVDDKTEFNKFVVPESIPNLKPGQSGQYFERQPIELSDIQVGDKVTVIALENIKDKTEFTAAMVEVHGQQGGNK